LTTQPPFSTFAASSFVNREAVVAALRQAAARAAQQRPGVHAVYLFGSFAHGTPTPRSDADVLVVAEAADLGPLYDCCLSAFLDAPVPVDLFVRRPAEVEAGRAAGQGLIAAALEHALLLYPEAA
jgi:predicted nucleotidyltransferase